MRVIIPTADRYYKRIRERIAADREAEREKREGHIEVDESCFGGYKDYNRLSLNGFHPKRINHDNPWSMAKCISTAQRAPEAMLKAYHGGFKRNFRLFRRERPLSFNHRDDENALNYLRSILRACS